MSITHCPICKEALHLWPSFTGGTCLFSINPHCSDNTEHPVSSSLPGHQDQSARLAASAPVDQVGSIPTLEQFERWLDDRMISLASEAANPCTTKSDAAELQAESDRTQTSLLHVYEFLRSFKLEQGK